MSSLLDKVNLLISDIEADLGISDGGPNIAWNTNEETKSASENKTKAKKKKNKSQKRGDQGDRKECDPVCELELRVGQIENQRFPNKLPIWID